MSIPRHAGKEHKLPQNVSSWESEIQLSQMLPQDMTFFNAFLHWTKINSSQSCELVGWQFSLFCLAQTLENKDQHLSWDSFFSSYNHDFRPI